MPFRSLDFSWRRLWVVAVLALLLVIAPRAAELCDATCAHAAAAAAIPATPMPAATMAAAAATGAGHCASHAASRHAVHAAHACGMPAHGLPVQVAADIAAPVSARTTDAPQPQRLHASALPAMLSAWIVPPQHVPLHRAQISARSARSRPLTLALRI